MHFKSTHNQHCTLFSPRPVRHFIDAFDGCQKPILDRNISIPLFSEAFRQILRAATSQFRIGPADFIENASAIQNAPFDDLNMDSLINARPENWQVKLLWEDFAFFHLHRMQNRLIWRAPGKKFN